MSEKPKFYFGNVVVVEDDLIGVIVKTWGPTEYKNSKYNYEVYVRSVSGIIEYDETQINHFVYSKELSEDEKDFY